MENLFNTNEYFMVKFTNIENAILKNADFYKGKQYKLCNFTQGLIYGTLYLDNLI